MYCRRKMKGNSSLRPTKDHVLPKSKGGTLGTPDSVPNQNRLIVCYECNMLKKNMTIKEFLRWLHRQERTELNLTRIACVTELIHNRVIPDESNC